MVTATATIFSTFPWRGKVHRRPPAAVLLRKERRRGASAMRRAAGWGESARSALRLPASPSTPPRAPAVRDPPPPGEGEISALILATRSASELDPWRGANWKVRFAIHHPPLAFVFPHLKRGGRTPTDAESTAALTGAARAQRSAHACRRSTTALTSGNYSIPKAQLQARLPGTRSARALPAFACPSPGKHLPPRS